MFKEARDLPSKNFFPTSRFTQESEGFFADELHTRASTGKPRKPSSPPGLVYCHKKGHEKIKKKKRKEKDQGRREGASSEGKVPCALHQEFPFFLVHEYLGLEAARLG